MKYEGQENLKAQRRFYRVPKVIVNFTLNIFKIER